ncbi:MAG: flagellar biosynthetic protein FliR, partial [Candidatus Zixiibacteriota bacterium]
MPLFDFINYGADKLQTLLLIILRASGLFLLAPIFSHRTIPVLIKAGFIIAIAIVLVPTVNAAMPYQIESFWQLAALGAKEILLGLLIGLIFRLIFFGAETAGTIIGYQIGFALFNLPDVEEGGQISILGQFWYLVAALIFLSINGHHLIVTAFAGSYEVIPPGVVGLGAPVGELMIKCTAYVFVLALKIAAPLMIALFLTDVALGTIAKTIPTMNVFFVGFPIKISVGLLVMAMALPAFLMD